MLCQACEDRIYELSIEMKIEITIWFKWQDNVNVYSIWW